jgi:hypothetical protein
VLRSSSWKLTKPLRAGRRVLANLAQARAWNPLRWPLLLSQVVRTVSTQGLGGALTRLQVSPLHWVKPASHPGQDVEPMGDRAANKRSAGKADGFIIIPVFNKWQCGGLPALRSPLRTQPASGLS